MHIEGGNILWFDRRHNKISVDRCLTYLLNPVVHLNISDKNAERNKWLYVFIVHYNFSKTPQKNSVTTQTKY